jgi:hypothetical protein
MAGYTRQSTFADGDTITAALFNNEYNQLLNAFSNTSGHKHDGTANEGPVIGLIGDAGETSPNNKVLIDTTNNYIEFYVEVSSAPVQQLYIADGAIIPVTDSDIDLGTTSLRFKDTYTDTVTTTGNVSIGGDLTVTGSATISGNLTFGDADTDSINLAAEIDSDIIPNTDGTYDLGSATKEWQDLYIDGTANIDSLVADTADINGGTIDGATIATSDITVGAGKTLNVSAGTLTLADNQISGDKVEGGTIAATTITTLASTTGNITTVNSTTTNATTVDSTNLEVTNLKAKDGTAAGSIANTTGVVTLGSSVLTTTDINGGTIDGVTIGGTTAGAVTFTDLSDGTITIAGFADEDNMVSDSATLLPTQQSVKAYVDSQVTAQDLDFQGDTGGALSIDLDSESLTIAGGTGLDTVGSGNTVTVNIDSTVATLTGTQTLTNKTLTSPDVNTPDIDGGTIDGTVIGGATPAAGTFTTLTANTSLTGTLATAAQPNITSVGTLSALTVTGEIAANGGIALGDNDKATFGASDDLQIFHTGTSSVITDTGTGDLKIRANNLLLEAYATEDDYLTAIDGGAVTIFYDGSAKLATTSTGIDVTGTATMDGLTSVVTTDTQGKFSGWSAIGTNSASGAIELGQVPAYQGIISYAADGNTRFLFDNTYGSTGSTFEFRTNTSATAKTHLKIGGSGDISFYDDTGVSQALFWDASAESLGIGTTSPDATLHLSASSNASPVLRLERNDTFIVATDQYGAIEFEGQDANTSAAGVRGSIRGIGEGEQGQMALTFSTASGSTTETERMRIDSSGNVGIGTINPAAKLDVNGDYQGAGNIITSSGFIRSPDGSAGTPSIQPGVDADTGFFRPTTNNIGFSTGGSERMRIDASGNVLVGKTATSFTTDGIEARADGQLWVTDTSGSPLFLSRKTTDGAIATFCKEAATVGSIGTEGGDLTIGVGTNCGLQFNDGNAAIRPFNIAGNTPVDNAVDLGVSGTRFKDLYLSGQISTNDTGGLSITADSVNRGILNFSTSTAYQLLGGSYYGYTGYKTGGYHRFFGSDGVEDMRIDSSGNLLVGKTDPGVFNTTVGNVIANLGYIGAARDGAQAAYFNRLSSDGDVVSFLRQGTSVGSVSVTTSATTYNTSSDARLKDVTGSARGLEVINKLNPVSYNWKADGKADEGLIAQEVLDIVPNAVSGSEEEMYQMDYSKLVVHLVAGMKEQQAQIEALQSEINLLKGE